jgi:hypothetical protein
VIPLIALMGLRVRPRSVSTNEVARHWTQHRKYRVRCHPLTVVTIAKALAERPEYHLEEDDPTLANVPIWTQVLKEYSMAQSGSSMIEVARLQTQQLGDHV